MLSGRVVHSASTLYVALLSPCLLKGRDNHVDAGNRASEFIGFIVGLSLATSFERKDEMGIGGPGEPDTS